MEANPLYRPTAVALIAALTVALLLGVVGAPGATAHSESYRQVTVNQILAETYDSPDGDCDPTDGQHTKPRDSGGSHGAVAFLPASGCGLNWTFLYFDGFCAPDEAVVKAGDGSGTDTYTIRILTGGDLWATTEATTLSHGTWETVSFTPAFYTFATVTADDVRVEYTVGTGDGTEDLTVDVVRYSPSCTVTDVD